MALALPYTIVNGDPVDANPVQSNYRMIESYTNQEVIDRAGTVAMTAQLKLVGNPVAALDAAPKQYVDQQLPIGVVMMYGGTTAPAGGIWLLCDGTEYQATTYPELAAVIGATAGRFNVPALVNRLPVGGGGTYAHHSTGGSADAALPIHSHTIDHTHAGARTGNETAAHAHNVSDHLHGAGGLTANAVGDHAHGVPLPSSQGFIADGLGGTSAGIALGGQNAYAITPFTSNSGAHGHSISGVTGAADRPLGTDGENAVHQHDVNIPGFSGPSGQAGVAAAGLNMPPFYAIAFIIKAK